MSKATFVRKFPRRQFFHKVGLLLLGEYYFVDGLEVGEGGLGFESDMSFPVEKELMLSFQIPGGDFAFVRAEIKNQKVMGKVVRYGATFKTLKFEAKKQIRAFVSNRPESENIQTS